MPRYGWRRSWPTARKIEVAASATGRRRFPCGMWKCRTYHTTSLEWNRVVQDEGASMDPEETAGSDGASAR